MANDCVKSLWCAVNLRGIWAVVFAIPVLKEILVFGGQCKNTKENFCILCFLWLAGFFVCSAICIISYWYLCRIGSGRRKSQQMSYGAYGAMALSCACTAWFWARSTTAKVDVARIALQVMCCIQTLLKKGRVVTSEVLEHSLWRVDLTSKLHPLPPTHTHQMVSKMSVAGNNAKTASMGSVLRSWTLDHPHNILMANVRYCKVPGVSALTMGLISYDSHFRQAVPWPNGMPGFPKIPMFCLMYSKFGVMDECLPRFQLEKSILEKLFQEASPICLHVTKNKGASRENLFRNVFPTSGTCFGLGISIFVYHWDLSRLLSSKP